MKRKPKAEKHLKVKIFYRESIGHKKRLGHERRIRRTLAGIVKAKKIDDLCIKQSGLGNRFLHPPVIVDGPRVFFREDLQAESLHKSVFRISGVIQRLVR